MKLDATFRPLVVAAFVVIMLIALPFRVRSQATGETLDRTQEGMAMLITLRLAGLAPNGQRTLVNVIQLGDDSYCQWWQR